MYLRHKHVIALPMYARIHARTISWMQWMQTWKRCGRYYQSAGDGERDYIGRVGLCRSLTHHSMATSQYSTAQVLHVRSITVILEYNYVFCWEKGNAKYQLTIALNLLAPKRGGWGRVLKTQTIQNCFWRLPPHPHPLWRRGLILSFCYMKSFSKTCFKL